MVQGVLTLLVILAVIILMYDPPRILHFLRACCLIRLLSAY